MKLDKSKAEGKVRFPFTPKRKKRKQSIEEAKKQYADLVRVGMVSMVQIGPDEFRTPTRRERRNAGFRGRRRRNPQTGRQGGLLGKPHTQVNMSLVAREGRRYMAAAMREIGTTRKAKLIRKAIEEHNREIEASV